MEGLQKKKGKRPNLFADTVFSWSLDDVHNERLYMNKVEKIPESFPSVEHYFGCYLYPLLEETRAQVQSSMETIYRAPYAQVVSFDRAKPYGKKLYNIRVDYWRNRFNDRGREPYKTLPGDLFVLANAKPETVSDLQRVGRSWAFGSVTKVSENETKEDTTSLYFRVKVSKDLEVVKSTSPLVMVFLVNLIPNGRIWKALHMSKNLNIIKEVLCTKSVARKNLSEHLLCKQYRRHPSRSFFPSSSFYDNIFLAAPILKRISHEEKYFKGSLFGHYSFINVIRGWEEKDEDGRNGKNMVDIGIVAQILQNLYKEWADSNQNLSIGIVTPCAAQIVTIKENLGQKYNNLDGYIVKVKTVDGFQGGEEDLIIFSTGRSNCHQSLEFILKPQSSGVVDYLLSDHEGRELDLLFEVTDQEMDIILFRKSSFIVGRSRTGKTTVLTMKLFQIEQWHQLAVRGSHIIESRTVEQSSVATEGKVIRQLFVTVSLKLCYAIKQQVLHLKRFSSGRSHPSETSLIDMVDFDEDEAQFNDLQDPFHEVPPHSYPLSITLHKFLIMLDGTLGNSYFERFLDVTEVTNGPVRSSRSIALQTFKRTEEVTFEKFSSLYWPHFNTELTKKLDATRVFTEMISHIKGSLGALDACDGKCSRDCYVKMSNCASNLSEEIRENIYRIIQAFEKLKMEYGEFDLADFVTDLQHGLRQEEYKGDHMDFVYIDEVQNLTMNPISLFRHMCHNLEEGFVFSGDTAQTIARGIVFRFQELRHLFYKKFLFESRTNKLDESKEKGQISEILHLTQNFRAHAGILKLSQSIAELLYRFFPESIDVLKPESYLIYGEAPVLLESGENENAIAKIFGNSGNVVGFGAEQVILVRDDSARNEIANLVGKHALVLTIVECKGLEFQLYHEHNYEMATMCFERAGDAYWQRRYKAAGLRALAGNERTLSDSESVWKALVLDAKGQCCTFSESELTIAVELKECESTPLQLPSLKQAVLIDECRYSFVNATCGRAEKDEDGGNGKKMVDIAFVAQIQQNLYKESLCETLVSSDSVLFQDSFHEVPQYTKGSCHGTTIFWVQIRDRVIVGVDSQRTQEWIGKKSVHYRRYELMMSGEDKKFLEITNGVYATLCGDMTRCFMMLDDVTLLNHLFVECMQVYAVNQGVAVQTKPTLMDVVDFASDFFLRNPIKDPTHKESTVHLCAWMPLIEEYHIIVVGDSFKVPDLMTQKVFRSGSGSFLGVRQLRELARLNIPIDEDTVLHELTRAATIDPYTGGLLDVWTLFRGNCMHSRRDRLINRLHYPVYANMLFEGRSMFVIICDKDGDILSPLDLLQYLQSRFDASITREDILWLCFPLGYIVYRVRLSSQECCDRWFESCGEYRQPIRRQRFTNLEKKCCDYYLAYATTEMFNRALRMQYFHNLADRRV